jgi:hypothetical protein
MRKDITTVRRKTLQIIENVILNTDEFAGDSQEHKLLRHIYGLAHYANGSCRTCCADDSPDKNIYEDSVKVLKIK